MKSPKDLDGKTLEWVHERTSQMAHLAEVIAHLQARLEAMKLQLRREGRRSVDNLKRLHAMEEERNTLLAENQNLLRAAKRMIAAGTTQDLRRKLQQVFDAVMGEETKCPF